LTGRTLARTLAGISNDLLGMPIHRHDFLIFMSLPMNFSFTLSLPGAKKPAGDLRNEHAQSTTLGTKLMFRVVSRHFVAARDPLQKRSIGVHLMHYFVPH